MLHKFTLRLEHISAIYVCSLKGYYHGNINMRCDWLHWSPSLVSCTEPENRTPVHSFTSAPVHPRVYACVGGSSKVLMKFWAYFRTRNVRFSHCTYFVIVLYILLWLLSHYISFKFLVGGIISVPPQPPHPSPPSPFPVWNLEYCDQYQTLPPSLVHNNNNNMMTNQKPGQWEGQGQVGHTITF